MLTSSSTSLSQKLVNTTKNLEYEKNLIMCLCLNLLFQLHHSFLIVNQNKILRNGLSIKSIFSKRIWSTIEDGNSSPRWKSPHLHFCVTTEHLSVKKYKNQKGEFHKETWSLNAKRYDPEFLAELHTRHALHNKPYGLVRGVRGSVRSNTPLKEFYRAVDKAMSTDYIKVLEEEISRLKKVC